jgi:hypothetical protein
MNRFTSWPCLSEGSLKTTFGFAKQPIEPFTVSGTFGAAAYAHKYPQHVGHFVLDANYPHAIVSRNLFFWFATMLTMEVVTLKIEQS